MIDGAHTIALGDRDFASGVGEGAHLSLYAAGVAPLVLEEGGGHPFRGLDPPGDANKLSGLTSHALLRDEVVPTPVIPRDVAFEY